MKQELIVTKLKIAAVAAIVGGSLVAFLPAAQAAPINGSALANAKAAQAVAPTEVQWRRRYYHRRYRRHHHHHHNDAGAFAAGSIFGLVTGAILGNAAANNNAVAYCSQRFRSYDPASGTYLGYDGYRHPCP
jgi:hypothetical protein